MTARSADHRDRRGAALLRVTRWTRTNPTPSEIERGYAAFGEAGELTARGDPDSWTRAAELLHQASARFAAAGSEAGRAQAEYTLGNLQYLLRSQWQPSIRAADAAADSYASVNDPMGMHRAAVLRASAELEIADGMSAEGQSGERRALFVAADRRLAEAAKFFKARGEAIDDAYAVNMRGIGYLYDANFDRAEPFFSEAAELARTVGDPRQETMSLTNLATINNRRGNIARAASEYARLIPLVDRDREQDLYANVIANYGRCLIALGEFDKALALHAEALRVFAARGDDKERARQLSQLGAIYARVGDLPRALEALRAAIVLHERAGDGTARATALRMAGNAAAGMGDIDAALTYLRESAKVDVNPQAIAHTRVLIAGLLRARGELGAAEQENAAALDSENALIRAKALTERAEQMRARSKFVAAAADLRSADATYIQLGLDFDRVATKTLLSRTLLTMGDLTGASTAADEAMTIEQRIRVKAGDPEWRARLLAAGYAPYEARIATDLARSPGSRSGFWDAFRISETVHARALADYLHDDHGRGEAGADPVADALRAQLTAQQLRLETRMLRTDADDAEIVELRRSIAEVRAQIDANALQGRENPQVGGAGITIDSSLERVQAALPPDTAVLAYFVGDEGSHAWLLSRTELRHAALPPGRELEKAAAALIAAQRGARGARPTRELSRSLLVSLLDGVREHRLLIIPDGPLNSVPFAALSLTDAVTEQLVDRFVVGYAPSLALAMRGAREAKTQHSRVAVVSDPVYAADDKRLALVPLPSEGVFRGPRPLSPHNFTRLPYSSLEARAVARAFHSKDVIQLAGFDATAASVRTLPVDDLAVLHFATHAVARRDAPEQSALYFSEFASDGKPLADFRLTAGDISRIGLRADLVVLSGCATGDGSELRGEGVLGLTYGFLANGSHAVVAALWPIQDASTARLMDEFYRAYRKSPRTADALRAAQLRTRQADSTVWSSFVVRANGFP